MANESLVGGVVEIRVTVVGDDGKPGGFGSRACACQLCAVVIYEASCAIHGEECGAREFRSIGHGTGQATLVVCGCVIRGSCDVVFTVALSHFHCVGAVADACGYGTGDFERIGVADGHEIAVAVVNLEAYGSCATRHGDGGAADSSGVVRCHFIAECPIVAYIAKGGDTISIISRQVAARAAVFEEHDVASLLRVLLHGTLYCCHLVGTGLDERSAVVGNLPRHACGNVGITCDGRLRLPEAPCLEELREVGLGDFCGIFGH